MDFTQEIVQFVSGGTGGIVVMANGSMEIVYANPFFTDIYGEDIIGKYADETLGWIGDCPHIGEDGAVTDWECIDTASKHYYKVESSIFEKEGKKYQIHRLEDISEYMGLNRDITKYMSFFKKLSGFQTAVLNKLTSTYYELMPMLADYFATNRVYFLIQHEGNADLISYNKLGKQYSNDRLQMNAAMTQTFELPAGNTIGLADFADPVQEVLALSGGTEDSQYRILCSGDVSGQRYALYLSIWPNMDETAMQEPTLLSVIKLYLENGIMREKLIYESEHDRLTGLYNKGKYLTMLENEYDKLDSIGIFNFDVNNLKKMNDTYGHEAGDKLLIKAANSIRKVTSNQVHGYRMGGDEYLMIACNVTQKEVDTLKERWEAELARLNTLEDDIHCVIAVGVVYAEKPYDLPALLKRADELMYEDKKRKKKSGEEIR